MLVRGDRARITAVSGEDAVAARLMEMGLVEGREIENLGAAPLGDPVEYLVCGYRLSLRRSEARRVAVG
ncbi:MAG: ferrous iron transport protein A [Planctomycetia bacterium]|nr:ferrous iron transport protein A [Planctomycetia bacterium]